MGMAHITRKYDDEGIVKRLTERSPGLDIDLEVVRVNDVRLTPATSNTPPTFIVELTVFVNQDDIDYVLGDPVII